MKIEWKKYYGTLLCPILSLLTLFVSIAHFPSIFLLFHILHIWRDDTRPSDARPNDARDCLTLSVFVMIVDKLSVIVVSGKVFIVMPSVIMPSAIVLCVIMPSVTAPDIWEGQQCSRWSESKFFGFETKKYEHTHSLSLSPSLGHTHTHSLSLRHTQSCNSKCVNDALHSQKQPPPLIPVHWI